MTRCPYQSNTFCNDGIPTSPVKPLKKEYNYDDYCDAFVGIQSFICGACPTITIVLSDGVKDILHQCELLNDCPYTGCSRHKKIIPVPTEMFIEGYKIRYGKDNQKPEKTMPKGRCFFGSSTD